MLKGSFFVGILAIIPVFIILVLVDKSDKAFEESRELLRKLLVAGFVSTIGAGMVNSYGVTWLQQFGIDNQLLYNFILYFIIVGPVEEFSKYLVLKDATWKHQRNTGFLPF